MSEIFNQAEKASKRIPILDKLEVDKVFVFLKLFVVSPFTMFTFGISITFGFWYGVTRDLAVLIGLVISMFSFIGFLIHKIFIGLKQLELEVSIAESSARLGMAKQIVESRENLRKNWITGWGNIHLEKLGIIAESMEYVIHGDFPADEKILTLTNLLQDYKLSKASYRTLLDEINSEIEEFSDNMNKPPRTNIQYLKELDDLLDDLRNN